VVSTGDSLTFNISTTAVSSPRGEVKIASMATGLQVRRVLGPRNQDRSEASSRDLH
jgi:hypothetical protein